MKFLELPPYSDKLNFLIEQELTPNNDVFLFFGMGAWKKGKAFSVSHPSNTVVLPAFKDPSYYYWPVKNCDVLMIDTSFCPDDYANDISYFLYFYGAKKVRLISSDHKLVIFDN